MFRKKNIEKIKTVGEILRQHREESHFSIAKIVQMAQLNEKYVIALENNDYKKLPAEIYTKNFLRKYARCLRLNPETVITQYEKELLITKNTKPPKPKKKTKDYFSFLTHPTFIKLFFIGIILISILGYLGFKVYQITAPPELLINDLEPTFSTTSKNLTITGKSTQSAEIKINDRQIVADQGGAFSIALDLQNGLNIIKISARTKHSRENIQYFQVIVQDEQEDQKEN